MDTQDMETSPIIEKEYTVKDEEETDNYAKEETDSKINEVKDHDSVEDFVSKVVKGKFVTLNEGNMPNQIIFNIDSMLGNISSVQKEENVERVLTNIQQYKLYELQECTEFVNEYKSSLHLAYAIAISMFEYVPISDLQRLAESLLRYFPKNFDRDGKEITEHISPFIPLKDILSIINAQTCMVSFKTQFENITERCACFNENHDKVMQNIWEQFPLLRSQITLWLIETDLVYSFRNAFSENCFVKALSNIVKMDFRDSVNRLFPQLVSREKNKYLMIRLMLLIIKDDEIKENACEILRGWAKSSKWLWEISFVVYGLSDEKLSFVNELEQTLTHKILDAFNGNWENRNINLIGGQMIKSLRLRNLVSGILYKLAIEDDYEKTEHSVAIIYLLMISNAYQFVNKDNMALPLIAIDNIKQLEHIEIVLYRIFSDFALRHSLFEILEVYIEEIEKYKVTDKVLNQLKSYFYVIAKKSARFNRDLRRFLSQIQTKGNTTAEIILSFISEKIPLNKEIIKYDTIDNK